jgi:drug/metabolite transporter (DMT)-like permease
MPFYLFAWIASFSYGLTGIIIKLTGKYAVSNSWLINFLFITFQLILTLPVALINHAGIPSHWNYLTLAAFSYVFFSLLYIITLSRIDITTYIPLFNFRIVISVILGITLLGESFNGSQFLLTALILFAGIFAVMDEKLKLSSFLKPEIAIALLSVAILAFNAFFINRALALDSYWTVTLWQYIIAFFILLTTAPKFKKDMGKLKIKQISAVFFIALSLFIGDLAANKAFMTNVGITSIIITLPFSMIIAFVLSFIAPKLLEKHTLKVYLIRFTAAAVMIAAALKITS